MQGVGFLEAARWTPGRLARDTAVSSLASSVCGGLVFLPVSSSLQFYSFWSPPQFGMETGCYGFSKPQNFKHHILNKKRVLALVRETLRSPVVGGLSPLCGNGILSSLFARCRVSCLPLNKKPYLLRDSRI